MAPRTPNYEGLTVADWLDCYKEKETPALLDLDFASPGDKKVRMTKGIETLSLLINNDLTRASTHLM